MLSPSTGTNLRSVALRLTRQNGAVDPAQVARIQAKLAESNRSPEQPFTAEELQFIWHQRNNLRNHRPNHADNTKINMVKSEQRWVGYPLMNGQWDK